VKLHGIPQAIASAICTFPDLGSACNTVISMIRFGIPVARCELLDEVQVRACNQYSKLTLPEAPLLLLEFHGTEAAVEEQLVLVEDIAKEWGGTHFQRAKDTDERAKLWEAREQVYWACLALRPGSRFIATDVCVPISRLAECIMATKADIEECGVVAPVIGHVGDGNFHVSVMAVTEDAADMARNKAFINRLNARSIAMDGTCTGEHGIGQGKQQFLLEEHGTNVDTMRAVKVALDPQNIMNPGKIFSLPNA
jgi:D-lactate dehydrogenase (cytochrome)